MDIVFLGVNDIGLRIYKWLCDRGDTNVLALLTERDQLDAVHRLSPDLIISVGFDHLVSPDILDVPPEGAMNLHPSLLPHNRGKSPNVWPIVDGTPAGVTLHYMDEEFDTGEIVAQRKVEKTFADTAKDLHRRLEEAQFKLFTEAWPEVVSGSVETLSQPENTGSYHSTEEFLELCQLDPDEEVRIEELLNRLRALTFPPFNNAEIEINDDIYYVSVEIRTADEGSDNEPDGLLESY